MKIKPQRSHIGWILGLSLLGVSQFQSISYAVPWNTSTHKYDFEDDFVTTNPEGRIRFEHFRELKVAIAVTQTACGGTIPAIPWSNPSYSDAVMFDAASLSGPPVPIRAVHIQALRNAIQFMYANRTPAVTPPSPNTVWDTGSLVGLPIRKQHLLDMRDALSYLRDQCSVVAGPCGQATCYACSGTSCVQNNAAGTYSVSNCNNTCTTPCGAATCYACSGSSCVQDNAAGAYITSDCGYACCGDGTQGGSEQCDVGPLNGDPCPNTCSAACTTQICTATPGSCTLGPVLSFGEATNRDCMITTANFGYPTCDPSWGTGDIIALPNPQIGGNIGQGCFTDTCGVGTTYAYRRCVTIFNPFASLLSGCFVDTPRRDPVTTNGDCSGFMCLTPTAEITYFHAAGFYVGDSQLFYTGIPQDLYFANPSDWSVVWSGCTPSGTGCMYNQVGYGGVGDHTATATITYLPTGQVTTKTIVAHDRIEACV